MSFFSLTPHLSVSPIVFSFCSSSFHLPDHVCHSFSVYACSDVYLLARLSVCLFGLFFFTLLIFLAHLNLPSSLAHKHTQTSIYEFLSLHHHPHSLFLYPSFLSLFAYTHTHLHTTHSHQMQADGPSARQAADPCPHTPNEHPLSLGGPSQNQTPNTTNTSVPTATHYQPPACCDIPCALIVQHSYEPTNPSELNPKMRMTTFTTSPPTPRLYIQ